MKLTERMTRSMLALSPLMFAVVLLGCPPEDKKKPAPTPSGACEKVGQSCEYSPGKLGSCVQKDECTSGNCVPVPMDAGSVACGGPSQPCCASRIRIGYSVPDESPVSRANAYPYCQTFRRVSSRTSTFMVWGDTFVGRGTRLTLHK